MTDHQTGDIPTGLPRDYLRPCLLLLLAEGPSHGYDLVQRAARMGWENADVGGLYRSLRSMEQEGLIESVWQPPRAGPARRTYALAAGGVAWLRGWARTARQTNDLFAAFFERYEALAEQPATRA
ncbi:MAG TPA: PadR family transcriptional regulator [Acidimicrobiia bacterium]|nr:PadR family transcriptional regulator [Acidimicrobiia bacterium]